MFIFLGIGIFTIILVLTSDTNYGHSISEYR